MMTEFKVLKAIEVPMSSTLAYKVPDGRALITGVISMVNKNASVRTVNIQIQLANTSTKFNIWPLNLSLATGACNTDTAHWQLSAGDEIWWDASGNTVD